MAVREYATLTASWMAWLEPPSADALDRAHLDGVAQPSFTAVPEALTINMLPSLPITS
jgi:hypothetical protein